MEWIIIGIMVSFCTVLCIKHYKLLKDYKELIKVKEENRKMSIDLTSKIIEISKLEVEIHDLKKEINRP